MQRKSTSIKYVLLVIVSCIFISFMPLSLVAQNAVGEVIGEGPAAPIHMSQEDIDSNQVSFEKIKLFGFRFLAIEQGCVLHNWSPVSDKMSFLIILKGTSENPNI